MDAFFFSWKSYGYGYGYGTEEPRHPFLRRSKEGNDNFSCHPSPVTEMADPSSLEKTNPADGGTEAGDGQGGRQRER